MRERPVPNRGGKIIIDFPPGLPDHDVDDKEIPNFLLLPPYDIYEWVGNFVIIDKNRSPVHDRLPVPYKAMVEKVSGKDKLVCWDGSQIIVLERQKDAKRDGRDYAVAELNLGDPPVGWA